MDSEEFFWLRLWQSILVAVVLFALVVGVCAVSDNYNGLRVGYCAGSAPGVTEAQWVKCQ